MSKMSTTYEKEIRAKLNLRVAIMQKSKKECETNSIISLVEKTCPPINKTWYTTPLIVLEQILYHAHVASCFDKLKIQDLDIYRETNGNQYQPLLFPHQSMTSDEYLFISHIDNNYINIDKKPLNEQTSEFNNICYNFDKPKLRFLIESLVDEIDREFCVVMGGNFTKYNKKGLISVKFPWLYSKICCKADVDIYLLHSHAHKYFIKFEHMNLDVDISKSISLNIEYNFFQNAIQSIKVKFNGENINFIFLACDHFQHDIHGTCNIFEQNINECFNIFSMLDLFDLNICKIFYSYYYDNIYAHVSLFREYNLIIQRCNAKNEICDLDFYRKKIINSDFFKFNKLTSKRLLLNYKLYASIIRYFKYSFKGYFIDIKEATVHIETIKELLPFFASFPTMLTGFSVFP
jgi:hypothetical protein